jgi:hypothetical protein
MVNGLVDLFRQMAAADGAQACEVNGGGLDLLRADDQPSREDLAAAVSEWLDCEDDPEMVEAEAEAVEQEMDARNQRAGEHSMLDHEDEEEPAVDLDDPPPVTEEDVNAACESLVKTLELFSNLAR